MDSSYNDNYRHHRAKDFFPDFVRFKITTIDICNVIQLRATEWLASEVTNIFWAWSLTERWHTRARYYVRLTCADLKLPWISHWDDMHFVELSWIWMVLLVSTTRRLSSWSFFASPHIWISRSPNPKPILHYCKISKLILFLVFQKQPRYCYHKEELQRRKIQRKSSKRMKPSQLVSPPLVKN